MSGTLDAKLVRVEFEVGRTGRVYATSPDIKGLMIGRPSRQELEEALPQAIADMYAACGLNVLVSRLDRAESDADEWVAFPADLARRALASQAEQASV